MYAAFDIMAMMIIVKRLNISSMSGLEHDFVEIENMRFFRHELSNIGQPEPCHFGTHL